MKKKHPALLAACISLLLLLAAAITGGVVLTRMNARRTITLTHPWNGTDRISALNQVLARFKSLYPNITVTLESEIPGAENPCDVAVIASPSGLGNSFLEPPIPWTGNLWLLAGRTEILDGLAGTLPSEIGALRAGNATPEQFRKILSAISEKGLQPITLGNSHKWPFMLFLEHWTAATQGPGMVGRIPDAAGEGAEIKAIEAAFEELMDWKKRGWFGEGLWDEGWTKGLARLDRGTAAFALVSAEYIEPIPPKNRKNLEYLAFPRRTGDVSWSIGSVAYIGIHATTRSKKEARLLVRFLSSPGITAELGSLTGLPFFAWNPQTGKNPEIVSSWAEAALTPGYEALVKRFAPGN